MAELNTKQCVDYILQLIDKVHRGAAAGDHEVAHGAWDECAEQFIALVANGKLRGAGARVLAAQIRDLQSLGFIKWVA